MKRVVTKGLLIIVLMLMSLLLPTSIYADGVVPSVEIDHPWVLADTIGHVYLLVQFDIPEMKKDPARPGPDLNLGLVIDRSGSMEDRGKMEYAIKAAQILVDKMRPSDRLSIVEYDDQINVLWPSTPVESPEMIKAKINSLTPRGSTNLTGGMLKGAEEVLKFIDRENINRVILLSDGLANQGVTNPQEIKRLVREYKTKGVTVTTMGLGLDYNEDLMQAIAENAGGNYYYIENPNQMNRIFQKELGTLFFAVAKDINLNFKATKAVKKVEVFGYLSNPDGHNTAIEMENLYSGEKRSLVLRLEIDPGKKKQVSLGKLDMTYTDMESKKSRSFATEIAVNTTTDPEEINKAENKNVVIEATLIEAEEYHEKQVKLFEAGDKKAALSNIRSLNSRLSASNAILNDITISKKIEALEMEAEQMDWAEQSAANNAMYLKSSKQKLYQAQKGKRSYYMLQEGDKGYEVERLQKALTDLGFYKGTIDEKFSPELTEAVKEYQKSENLTVDGVVGPATLKKLNLY
jgi:Ca-activated chloride channel homolog